ncbi:MAG: hypothetical protein IKO10_03860 [Lachnospiraceae bacterium]|nr:hypothetical protein [Lachnospiraceae bacterium]
MIEVLSKPPIVFAMGMCLGLFCGLVLTALLSANTRAEESDKIASLEKEISRITEGYERKIKELEDENK